MSGLSHSCKSLLFTSFPSRDGRIELRAPSAPSARLAARGFLEQGLEAGDLLLDAPLVQRYYGVIRCSV